MLNNYQNQELHVTTRTGFPASLKTDLIDGNFTNWKQHPKFLMSGAALHAFHNRLRKACDTLTNELGNEASSHNKDAIYHWRLPAFGQQIIEVAHSHHHAEDNFYFPQYRALFPQLDRPLDLLDGDHRVLEQSLDDLQASLGKLSESSTVDKWEKSRDIAEELGRVINRHLDDEEEIVMPAIIQRDA